MTAWSSVPFDSNDHGTNMWDEILSTLESKYGLFSMHRVRRMLTETPQDRKRRNPLQARAQYILPDLSETKVISPNKNPDLSKAKDGFAAKHSAIRREILSYLERTGRPQAHGGSDQLGGEQWRVVFLNRAGRDDANVSPLFPETMSHIKSCAAILCPFAGISFSLLEPGGYIAPHSDRTNIFIHLHQSVVAPPGCGLRVGGMELAFEEKMSYLFDPSFVHEAWNRSTTNRIQLILPVWHPDTTSPEREALTEVFQSLRELTGH